MLINIIILGYIFGIFSLGIFCIFKQSSKISVYEELEKIKRQEFDKKYNLGKDFCEDNKNNK